MDFPERLATLRRDKGLTQQSLADLIGVHVVQLRRYEAGKSQPTLDVLRRLAVALSVSADVLLFDTDERGPQRTSVRQRLEAIDRLDEDELHVIETVLDSILLKHEARRYAATG